MSSLPSAAETRQEQEKEKQRDISRMLAEMKNTLDTRIWYVRDPESPELSVQVFSYAPSEEDEPCPPCLPTQDPCLKRMREHVQGQGLTFLRMEEKKSVYGKTHMYDVVLENPYRPYCLGGRDGSIPYVPQWRQGFLPCTDHPKKPVSLAYTESPWHRTYWNHLTYFIGQISEILPEKIHQTEKRFVFVPFENRNMPIVLQLAHELHRKGYRTRIVPGRSPTEQGPDPTTSNLEISW